MIPPTVEAMADPTRSHVPTAPLDAFLQAYREDDNWWWRIGQGHQLNLFEAALERIEQLEQALHRADPLGDDDEWVWEE